MMHGFRVSITKGVAKKHILKQDESLTATETALDAWKSSMTHLLDAIQKNEQAWDDLFATYTSLQAIGTCIYSPRDTGVLTFLKELKESEALLEVPVDGLEPVFNARQRILVSKQELKTVLEQIEKVHKMHLQRFEAIRQYKYYDDKTRQMLAVESKRRVPQKDIDRRMRNQNKVTELSQQVTNISNMVFTEMENVNNKRLAVTDGAMAALIFLQKHHFAHNPIKPAVLSAERIRLGARTPKADPGFWIPSSNAPQTSNSNISTPVSHEVPTPSPPPTYTPPTYNGELHGPYYPTAPAQYAPSAPPHVPDDTSAPDYVQPTLSPSLSYEPHRPKTPEYSNAIA